ncbi:MAG: LuxR C-terminal-related transcriptional regulator, partial [Actinoallomurus sp.]
GGFVAAAGAAQTTNAWAVALAHYERALRLWPEVADAESHGGLAHAELLRRAAEVAMAEGETDRALRLTEASMAEVDADATPVRAAALRILMGRIQWVEGDLTAACASYDKAVALLPAEASTRERAQVRALQGHAFMLQSRYTDAVACCREAIAVAVAVDAPDLEGHARNTLGVCLTHLGDSGDGLDQLAAALRIARAREDTWELGRTYVNFSDALLNAGRWAEAAEIGMEGVHVCRGLGYGRTTCMCAAGNTLAALVRLGRWPDADRLVDEVNDIDAPQGQRWGVTLAMADLDLRRGRLESARRHLASVAGTAARSNALEFISTFRVGAAWLALSEGDYEDAREHVRAGLALISGSEYTRIGPQLCSVGLSAEVALGGDPDLLLEHCRESLGAMTESPEPDAYGRHAEAEATRLTKPDPSAWLAALTGWEELGEPYNAAYCRFRAAEAVLAVKGSREEAGDLLRMAHETAVSLGADLLREKMEALSRRGRLELVQAAGTVPGLTAREGEILALLSGGRTNRQIAEELFISERTVGVHVSRILHKLGVPNRGAAAHLFRASE